jgi:hypothetical protein
LANQFPLNAVLICNSSLQLTDSTTDCGCTPIG